MLTKATVTLSTIVLGALIIIAAPDLPAPPHPAYAECGSSKDATDRYCRTLATISGAFDRIVETVESRDRFIVAVTTIAIAWFTFVLWQSTHRLWRASEHQVAVAKEAANAALQAAKAADLSARAAVGIELPVVRTEPPELLDVDTPPPEIGPYASAVISNLPRRYAVVDHLIVRNHGRSPAFPIEIAVGHAIIDRLPPRPIYSRIVPAYPGAIINKGDPTGTGLHYLITIDDAALAALRDGSRSLWLYGYVRYADFMENLHHHRFCWRWCQPDGVGLYGFAVGQAPAEYIAND